MNDRQKNSLLVYLETCAVDYSGKVVGARMNAEEIEQARQWHEEDYLQFGRLPFKDIPKQMAATTHWVVLSDNAWQDAHRLRRERSDRNPSKHTSL